MFKKSMFALLLGAVLCVALTVWFAGRAQYWSLQIRDPACLTLTAEQAPGNACEAARMVAEQRARLALGGAGLCLVALVLSLAWFLADRNRRRRSARYLGSE